MREIYQLKDNDNIQLGRILGKIVDRLTMRMPTAQNVGKINDGKFDKINRLRRLAHNFARFRYKM